MSEQPTPNNDEEEVPLTLAQTRDLALDMLWDVIHAVYGNPDPEQSCHQGSPASNAAWSSFNLLVSMTEVVEEAEITEHLHTPTSDTEH